MRTFLAASMFLVASTPLCFAAGSKGAPSPTVMIARGICQQLVTAGSDHTKACSGKLLNTSYKDGRVGFLFMTDDGAALTFTGMGSQQIMPDPDSSVQPVDGVIFTYKGETAKAKAVGSCRFTNPFKKASVVSCKADSGNGPFSAAFQTDGNPPEIMAR